MHYVSRFKIILKITCNWMLQFSAGLYQEIVLKYLKRKGTCSKIKIHVNSATERYHLKKVPRDPPNQGNTTCSHNAMKDKHEY